MNTKGAIAVIPARGGSKRIPRKNIKLFHGKPLISYSIKTLIQSDLFDHIYVSTDDQEIADVSLSYGAEVPFLRDPILAGDQVLTVPVIADFITNLRISKDYVVCCAYPTAPLMRSQDLITGFSELNSRLKPDYVCAVAKYAYPIQRALQKNNGLMNMVNPKNVEIFSQQLEERFHDAGQFYFAFADTWTKLKPMLLNTFGVELPSWRVQDIDTIEDWERAEILYELLNLNNQI
jgi:pseudaminic acid cytidylyltransferase